MTQVPHEPPQRERRRYARPFLLASLAAVLVIGVLAVTSVLLFNRPGKGNGRQSTTPPVSVTLSDCSSLPESWQVNLCTQHQFKNLLQWRRMGEYIFVLERAYVDLDQLVMTYHVFSQSAGQEMLATLDAVITSSQGQAFMPSFAGWKSGGPQVAQFNTTPLPIQTQLLRLHIVINTLFIRPLPEIASAPRLTAVHGPVAFDLTLDYHGGLIVTPNQTVMVKGLGVTLERVRIAPSETIIEGTTTGTFPHSLDYTLSLDAAGHNSSGLLTEPEFEGDSPFSAFTFDRWLGQRGMWTFTISYHAGPYGPWVFRFIIPL